ncbi:hypothetical protein KI387_003889 [Taxus chinensis]|uniref:Fungal lipase-type domain-containing protein n=1 Tax=Taxus chinensis TaxID=29808 RepID=A0AA38GZZ8_TAXCH|nr:hypothetical protein KI387_003889 [Taxus chinensis]
MEASKLSWLRRKLAFKSPSSDEEEKKLEEEQNLRLKELRDFCTAVKADGIHDLQHILCAMVLSECVYKRDTAVMIEAINKFKDEFGGQLVNLKRVQPCLDHVLHRYLLAESGDTLFASFIGTQQYRDLIADANIFQGAIFQDDTTEDNLENEESHPNEENQFVTASNQKGTLYKGSQLGPARSILQAKEWEVGFTPAAHRGFLARAKGIPAVELYRLAQKRKLKLVLCGHSMGGAVAVLATLAILRAFPSASLLKDRDGIVVKCITFSQPPVGNATLRDYVHGNSWQQHFRTYCIPEDVVPRILSPAYFQHYFGRFTENNSQHGSSNPSLTNAGNGLNVEGERLQKPKQTEGESLVLGLGPVESSFQRLSRLVPILGVQKQLDWLRGRKKEPETSEQESSGSSSKEVSSPVVQSVEIQEEADGLHFRPLPNADKSFCMKNESSGTKEAKNRETVKWHRVPSFPTYVPFGQLHLLAKSSVEPLSASEYASLTSVQSVLMELRERFQSHSMKSYRSRFHKIYELCLSDKSVQTFRHGAPSTTA